MPPVKLAAHLRPSKPRLLSTIDPEREVTPMAARWYTITAPVRHVLTDQVAYDGPRVTITEQLGSTLWPKVKTVLEKSGAVYVTGSSSFDFEPDRNAQTIVSAALSTGRIMSAANADGYVPTPAALAAELVSMYGEVRSTPGRRLRVLEPSAGVGRFVRAIRAQLGAEWCEITAVEPDARRARQIPADDAVSVVVDTFEAYARGAADRFDVIVMNPPFVIPGRPTMWVKHLRLAWELLAPGGRLVAILPASVLDEHRTGSVREAGDLVRMHGGGELLGRDAFAESGFTVDTAVVWLDRPLTDQPATLPDAAHPYVFRAYGGEEQAVTVARPYMSRAAALTMPVQGWRDGWRGSDRVLRYRADCAVCGCPVWGFDDGENDPRGVLGDQSAGFSLDPYEYDAMAGMPVGLCVICGSEREPYERALSLARAYWARVRAVASNAHFPAADVPGYSSPALDGSPWLAVVEQLALA